MTDYIAAGYVAVGVTLRPDWPGLERLPSAIVSLDSFVAPQAPRLTWVGPWEAEAARFGVSAARIDEARAWINGRDALAPNTTNEIFYPDVSCTPEVPAEFVQRFAPGIDSRILGYALRVDDADPFLAQQAHAVGQEDGIITMLQRREPLAPDGRLLGYEPCGVDFGGINTSWLVHGLPGIVERECGAQVNDSGFVDPSDADIVGEYIQSTPGKEPGIWNMWAVFEYPR